MDRPIVAVLTSQPVMEGAGVRLHRVFGHAETRRLDPFLMLDDFSGERPADFVRGFPWHPHRGIETVTYILHGLVEHEDSMGNRGAIGDGEVQWMTAGSGIIHQEMPQPGDGSLTGFQLWVNLPARHKMTRPRYQGITAGSVPVAELAPGVVARVVAGSAAGVRGPVEGLFVDPLYLDVELQPGATLRLPIAADHTAAAYVFRGAMASGSDRVPVGQLALFGEGDVVSVRATQGGRYLLIAGRPLREPIAWGGPMVMNTEEELELAFREYRQGTFVKA